MRSTLMHNEVFSVLGLFDSAQRLTDAIPVVRQKVAGRLEAYTPYPIHGIEKLLGLRKSPIAGMTFIMGLIGAISGMAFELWTNGKDYPLITMGKPYFSWEAFVPIMFEVTVLFACFTAGLGMLQVVNQLPYFRHPMLHSKSMPLITRDKFALAVEAEGKPVDIAAVSSVLRAAGAESIEIVENVAPPKYLSPTFFFRSFMLIVLACLISGCLMYWTIKLFPKSIPVVHMLDQPKLDPQRESSFFDDGFGMRMPVAGTIPRDHLPYTIKDEDAAAIISNPLPRTAELLEKGQQDYMANCSVCHGVLGDGKASLTAAYGAKPADYHSQTIRELPDGKIFHVITSGKNTMPSYAAELSKDERWGTVHYVRALQRAYDAKDTDVPEEIQK
jgi:mono/diheme cytochrome c family protein